MDDRKLEIIQQLMEQLQDEMGHSPDDLASRLGREKPAMGMISIEAGDDDDMGDDDDEQSPDFGDMDDPGQKLKERLLKLRG